MLALLSPLLLRAQTPPHLPPEALLRLQVRQPPVDLSSQVTATAAFDPPVARVGQQVFYRVSINAAEASIQWPGKISIPSELQFSPVAQGQVMEYVSNRFRPLTAFLYKVRARATGRFTVPNFVVKAQGKPVQIPEANLEVDNSAPRLPVLHLMLEVSATNVFLGQPLRARVILPASPSDTIEALRAIQFNGDGFMSDKTTTRQVVEMTRLHGLAAPAYIYETTLTPIMTGTLKFSAQAFTAGREFTGPVQITARVVIPGGTPHYVFLVSEPVQVHVRPLPNAGQLPGFTGSIGKFTLGQPQLSTDQIRVGQPVRLTVAVHRFGDLNHLVPPTPPLVNDWEIIPDHSSAASGFSYTLIPLTDEAQETPAIPFSAFDPETASYVNLTVPSLPVTVTAPGLPTELPAVNTGFASTPPLKLSALSPGPGKSVAGLKPPQLDGRLVSLQFVPLLGFLALWQWDRRRRFLAAHPDIVRRREARRALRRERRRLRESVARGDGAAFIRCAADAMKIAAAPHYAAHPQALVCAEVLEQLDDAEQRSPAGETVRKIFAAADARFAAAPQTPAGWATLQSEVNAVLLLLEEKL